jgi:hypothetical protein
MAAICRVADNTRDAQLDAIAALIDAGAGPGLLRIYDGTQPADADDSITTQNLLAELPFGDPCAGPAVAGVLTFNTIAPQNAVATGTATWARVLDSDLNNVMDVNVGTASASLIMNTTAIVSGGPVQIDSFVLRAPAT